MELSTTRDAGGALTTRTPGAPAQASNYGDLFAALIKQRMAQQATAQAAAPVAQAAPVNSAAERGAIPEERYAASQPRDLSEVWGSSGTQGAPIKPKVAPITRNRLLKGYQDPNAVSVWGSAAASKAMNPGTTVQETYLGAGLGWSGDAMYGSLEGNEAAARQAMEINSRILGGTGGGPAADPVAAQRDDVRPDQSNPYNRNNDSRGEGYGFDYNNRRPVGVPKVDGRR